MQACALVTFRYIGKTVGRLEGELFINFHACKCLVDMSCFMPLNKRAAFYHCLELGCKKPELLMA